MDLLVDTDVLLDVALGRKPWGPKSRDVLNLCQGGPHTAFVAWHSVSTVYYIVTRQSVTGGREDRERLAREFIEDLLRFAQVAPVDTEAMRLAVFSLRDVQDLEDAMQIAAAVACHARAIITRNTRHYTRSPVPAVTPAEFLKAHTQ